MAPVLDLMQTAAHFVYPNSCDCLCRTLGMVRSRESQQLIFVLPLSIRRDAVGIAMATQGAAWRPRGLGKAQPDFVENRTALCLGQRIMTV